MWARLALSWVLAASSAAWSATITMSPSEALQCMTPSESERAAINYPPAALDLKIGGVVRTEMTFVAADSPPGITVLDQPLKVLADAVKDHLRRYRVPCLQAGQRAVITQDFRFNPSDGRKVQWTKPRDQSDADRKRQQSCFTGYVAPDYPMQAVRREEQGIVVLKFTFSDATSPPQVTVMDDTPSVALIDAAKQAMSSMRMPCHTGAPASYMVDFVFKIDGGDRVVIRDMPLSVYIRSLKDIKKAQVYFDFNEMKCPFDLRVSIRQPTGDNAIGELGESVPERAFFIDWLARQRMVLPARQQNRLIGQQFNLSVPCGSLNLTDATGGGASQ